MNQFLSGRTLRRLGSKITSSFGSEHGVDIEKLISLLGASGVNSHTQLADSLRKTYFAELRASLGTAKVRDNPQLATRLIQLHSDPKFREEVEVLSGIITTNHDGLLQIASQNVLKEVNIGFKFFSKNFIQAKSNSVPPIVQLHGSFTWRFGTPIKIDRLRRTSKYEDAVWIPPTILKESKNYPFNKLSGVAYELLTRHCDVLRVVGSSLTQNDWNVLSLIFNAQQHGETTRGRSFQIELIMPQTEGEKIRDDCAFLQRMIPIGFLTEGRLAEYKTTEYPPESDMANPFAYWLGQKIEHHSSRGELSTSP